MQQQHHKEQKHPEIQKGTYAHDGPKTQSRIKKQKIENLGLGRKIECQKLDLRSCGEEVWVLFAVPVEFHRASDSISDTVHCRL